MGIVTGAEWGVGHPSHGFCFHRDRFQRFQKRLHVKKIENKGRWLEREDSSETIEGETEREGGRTAGEREREREDGVEE